jgi:mono/diheme cytochrome c family protein
MKQRDWRVALVTLSFLAILVMAASTAIVALGLYNVAADAPHTGFVRNVLEYARIRSIAVHAEDVRAPSLDKQSMIVEGASHYDAMCTGCHQAPGMKENEMRPGLDPKPPVLANGGLGTPAQMFWVIKHGIKMTGMPAWGVTHTDEEIWNVVAFLQRLPTLSPAQFRALITPSGSHREHGADHMDMRH